jgi:hypothetical protein
LQNNCAKVFYEYLIDLIIAEYAEIRTTLIDFLKIVCYYTVN